jgi:phosphoribosylamine--glycine ligase
MAARDTPFTGILFAGLMLTPEGPKLIEYNVRLGDPETQVLLPLLARSDILAALCAAARGELANVFLQWLDLACAGVVMAAPGYPGDYMKNLPIAGLDRAAAIPHTAIFHAGTDLREGTLISSGGRVLTICATGASLAEAQASAYQAVHTIDFPGGIFRTDIGQRALKPE